MWVFIAAVIDWKPLSEKDAASLNRVIEVDKMGEIPPVDITVTMSKRRLPGHEEWTKLHDTTLAPEAFHPKKYSIRLEKGTFPVKNNGYGYCHWYTLRLHMDPSPYPPFDEWTQKRPADIHKYWEWKDFHGEQIEGDKYYDPEKGISRRGEGEPGNAEKARELKARLAAKARRGDV